jgi:hypothetical protein
LVEKGEKMKTNLLPKILILLVFLSQMVYAQDKINSSESKEVSNIAIQFLKDWLIKKNNGKPKNYFSRQFLITCFAPNEEFTTFKKWVDGFNKYTPQIRQKLVKGKKQLPEIIMPSVTWAEKSIKIEHKYDSIFTFVSLPNDYFKSFVSEGKFTCNNYGKDMNFKEVEKLNDLYMLTFEFKEMKEAKVMLILAKIDKKWKIISFENGNY